MTSLRRIWTVKLLALAGLGLAGAVGVALYRRSTRPAPPLVPPPGAAVPSRG